MCCEGEIQNISVIIQYIIQLVNSNTEELYMRCQNIDYIGSLSSPAPLLDLYFPLGLEILHNELLLGLQRS